MSQSKQQNVSKGFARTLAHIVHAYQLGMQTCCKWQLWRWVWGALQARPEPDPMDLAVGFVWLFATPSSPSRARWRMERTHPVRGLLPVVLRDLAPVLLASSSTPVEWRAQLAVEPAEAVIHSLANARLLEACSACNDQAVRALLLGWGADPYATEMRVIPLVDVDDDDFDESGNDVFVVEEDAVACLLKASSHSGEENAWNSWRAFRMCRSILLEARHGDDPAHIRRALAQRESQLRARALAQCLPPV